MPDKPGNFPTVTRLTAMVDAVCWRYWLSLSQSSIRYLSSSVDTLSVAASNARPWEDRSEFSFWLGLGSGGLEASVIEASSPEARELSAD